MTAAHTLPPAGSGRLWQVDALKALASQLIVLHHLAFYGPMSDSAARLAPGVFEALSEYGRWAVQVFLVVAGYLAARNLAPGGRWAAVAHPGRLIGERYLRLVLPLAATLVLAVVAAALARTWMVHPSVPAEPSLDQLVAHLLLIQDVAGFEVLSAGLWYVAIDLQLYVVLVLLLGAGHAVAGRLRVGKAVLPLLVLAGVAASAFVFNRQPDGDVWAPYFFAAYGLGVLAAWCRGADRRRWGWGLAAALVVASALAVDWRPRLAVAGLTALVLVLPWGSWADALAQGRHAAWRGVEALGRTSYSVFLVHFPVCLVVNAAFHRWAPDQPAWQLAGVLAAWGMSVAAGLVFHRAVEAPAMRWVSRRPATGVPDGAPNRAQTA